MESAEAIYHVPLLLRGLCYLGGAAVYMASFYWFLRTAVRHDDALSLRQRICAWLARLLAALSLASLGLMIYSGQAQAQPMRAAPEVSILLLLLALFLLVERRRFLGRGHILRTRLPMEILKIASVSAACAAGLVVAAMVLKLFTIILGGVGAPAWAAVMATAVAAIIPLAMIFSRAQHKDRSDSIRAYHLLWPLLLICLLLMLPDLAGQAANSKKLHDYLYTPPRLQKV